MGILQLATAALVAATTAGAPAPHAPALVRAGRDSTPTAPPVTVHVRVDSARHRIHVVAGPFALPAVSPDMDMDAAEMSAMSSPVLPFAWPVQGWLRGFRVAVEDAHGRALPNGVLHHLIGVNFDRRQLVYHAVERLFGWGAETDPVTLPGAAGVPLQSGEKLGMYAMWHNETGKDIPAAYLHVTLLWTPRAGHHLVAVFPFYADVHNVVGGVTTFDVPPGKSKHSYTFEIPISGGLVAVGGHLHDFGRSVWLADGASGKVLVKLDAKRDRQGHVLGVGRFIFGFNTDALHLKAHHPYRVVAEYDNPTDTTFRDGGMGHIDGAFIPDHPDQWPRLRRNDPEVQKDLATLPIMTDMHAHQPAPEKAHSRQDGMQGMSAMKGMSMHQPRTGSARQGAGDESRRKPQ